MLRKLGIPHCLLMSCAIVALGASACGGETFEETQQAQVLLETPEAELPAVVTTVIAVPTADPNPTPIVVEAPTAVPETVRTTAVEYTVAAGDALGIIADRYGVTSSAILDQNPDLSSGTLQVGQVITIPAPASDGTTESASGADETATATPTASPTATSTSTSSGSSSSSTSATAGPTSTPRPSPTPIERDAGTSATHRIQSGDLLDTLARRYGVSVSALIDANPGVAANNLRIDADLSIPPVGTGIDPAVVPTAAPTPTPLNVTPVPTATVDPNATATPVPTVDPNATATAVPTVDPNATATAVPTAVPTVDPNASATAVPTAVPTVDPNAVATAVPTAVPTVDPNATAVPTPTPAATTDNFGFDGCDSLEACGFPSGE